MVSIFKFLSVYIIPIFELIPVLVGILYYKYLTTPFKIIFYYAILYVVMDSLNSSMAVFFHLPSKPYVDTMAILGFAMISFFYILVLNKKWKTPIIILLVTYYLLWIADFWFIEAQSPMNIYPLSFQSVLIMLYTIIYMNQQTQTNIEHQWSADPVNWIGSGFLVFCSSSVVLTLFYDLMLKMNLHITVFIILWEINTIAAIVQLILISIGIYKCKQSQTISL